MLNAQYRANRQGPDEDYGYPHKLEVASTHNPAIFVQRRNCHGRRSAMWRQRVTKWNEQLERDSNHRSLAATTSRYHDKLCLQEQRRRCCWRKGQPDSRPNLRNISPRHRARKMARRRGLQTLMQKQRNWRQGVQLFRLIKYITSEDLTRPREESTD